MLRELPLYEEELLREEEEEECVEERYVAELLLREEVDELDEVVLLEVDAPLPPEERDTVDEERDVEPPPYVDPVGREVVVEVLWRVEPEEALRLTLPLRLLPEETLPERDELEDAEERDVPDADDERDVPDADRALPARREEFGTTELERVEPPRVVAVLRDTRDREAPEEVAVLRPAPEVVAEVRVAAPVRCEAAKEVPGLRRPPPAIPKSLREPQVQPRPLS